MPLDHVIDLFEIKNGVDLVALDDILRQLEARNKRHSEIFMLRFFGGLTTDEIAEQLGVSDRTVRNDFRFAKLWLRRRLGEID